MHAVGPRCPRRGARPSRLDAVSASEEFQYDLFTIGGGSAGVRAARYSSKLGMFLPSRLVTYSMTYTQADFAGKSSLHWPRLLLWTNPSIATVCQ